MVGPDTACCGEMRRVVQPCTTQSGCQLIDIRCGKLVSSELASCSLIYRSGEYGSRSSDFTQTQPFRNTKHTESLGTGTKTHNHISTKLPRKQSRIPTRPHNHTRTHTHARTQMQNKKHATRPCVPGPCLSHIDVDFRHVLKFAIQRKHSGQRRAQHVFCRRNIVSSMMFLDCPSVVCRELIFSCDLALRVCHSATPNFARTVNSSRSELVCFSRCRTSLTLCGGSHSMYRFP